MIVMMFLSPVLVFAQGPSEPHNANSMWIEPSSLSFNTASTNVGYKFNVTLYANVTHTAGVDGIGAWQFKLLYESSQLNATKAWYKTGKTSGQSQFFENITVKTISPQFKTGSVTFGESWAGDPTTGPFAYPPIMGGLAIVEFNITAAPPPGGKLTSVLDIATPESSGDTFVADYDTYADVLDNVYNANYEYKSSQAPPPSPFMAVDPASRTYGPSNVVGIQFDESVYIKSLDASFNIVNASLNLHYDHTPNILAVRSVTFSSGWNVATSYDNSTYGTLGLYAQTNAISPPLSGNVLIASVHFEIIHQGTNPASDTVPLTFSDIILSSSMMQIPTGTPVTGSITILGLILPTGTTLAVDPSSIIDLTMLPSSTFYVNVTISNIIDLKTCQFNLTYDSSVLNAVGFSLLRIEGQYPLIDMDLNNTMGYMWVRLNYSTPFSTGSPLPMIRIQFHVESLGLTFLNLTDTQLSDSNGTPISHQRVDGFFMNFVRDVAVTNVVPSQTWAYAGWIVNIDVTVKNLGNFSETFDVNATYDGTLIGTVPVNNLASDAETTVTIPWDTTGVLAGTYTITGAASTLPFELNTANNVYVDSTVQILTLIHDVAITDVSPARNWVYQGNKIKINVTTSNLGNLTETFNVTAYAYNATTGQLLIGTIQVTGLAPQTSTTLTFTWNTTTVPYCHNYTISGQASIVPYEYNTTNNVYEDGTIKVRIMGDANGDGKVNIIDLLQVAKAFGSYGPNYLYPGSPPDPRWDPSYDMNQDNKVNIIDMLITAKAFGKTC
jgi:hypothetical protein